MPKSSRALRSRRVLVDGLVAPRTLIVTDGCVAAIEPYDVPIPSGFALEDFGDDVIMAGLTDVHVHVNEPGRTDWEGFATATRAAAAGGVTTLIDMPLNSTPVTTTASAFETKLEAAQGALMVDVGYWGGVVPDDVDELPGLLASGVLGLKAFLVHSGIEDFPNVSAADLERALPLLAPTALPLLVHCELSTTSAPVNPSNDPRSYQQYLASRPGQWELDAIALVLELSRQHNARVHIVHLSCADALPLLKKAKAEGLPVTVETCPHYLVLDAETIPDGDTRFKCAPPIRSHENRDRLWGGLADGTIDFIATDHSPCPPDLKRLEAGDFTKAWGGIASIQFLLPVVWTEAQKRGFGLADLERWVCTRPAAFAGLANTSRPKGRIAPGFQADLVVWRPEQSFFITPSAIEYRHKVTPYGDRSWLGVVRSTWLAGEPVWPFQAPALPARGRSLLRLTTAWDSLSDRDAETALKRVCASDIWVQTMLGLRPFGDFRGLSRAAGQAWNALARSEQIQAMAAHPRIGEKYRNNPEQAGVLGVSSSTLDRLLAANEAYEARFGFRFLVFATGKSAEQMLALLEGRLGRDEEGEWNEARAQHHKITLFRLAQAEPRRYL